VRDKRNAYRMQARKLLGKQLLENPSMKWDGTRFGSYPVRGSGGVETLLYTTKVIYV
jgi:hypothetical protein